MTVAMTQAVRLGARAVACASTGNTSASLAAYAAQAGLRAIVFIPAGKVATGKLAQTLAYGATALQIRGDFDAAMRLVREASDRLGIYLVNSINPFRIEGQKTIVWELLQDLEWNAPDWIVVPAGNLGNTSAFGKALREAFDAGWIRTHAAPGVDPGRAARIRSIAATASVRATPSHRRGDDRQRDPHRRSGQPSQGRGRDPLHERHRRGGHRRGVDARQTRDRRDGHRLRAGIRDDAGRREETARGRRDARRRTNRLRADRTLLKDTDAIMRNVPAERTIEIDATMDAVERALSS